MSVTVESEPETNFADFDHRDHRRLSCLQNIQERCFVTYSGPASFTGLLTQTDNPDDIVLNGLAGK